MFANDVARIRSWMFETALPLWASKGIDHINGGYCESLNAHGNSVDPGYKRLRVIGRQIYVFSHAYKLGWEPGLALAQQGFEFMVKGAWLGPTQGWARRLSPTGQVIDATPDLYDNAFVLFALGWYYRASGDPSALKWAKETCTFLTTHMRHSSGIGFLHEKPAHGPRQQNPHMHLLEAALACYEAWGDPQFEALAREVVTLFQSHLFNGQTRRLPEFFDEKMVPTEDALGRITEPGHQLEWAWILANAKRLLDLDIDKTAKALIESAEHDGVHPISRATYNQVRDDGILLDDGWRTWPNTERIKAHIAAYELFGNDPRQAISESIKVLFDHFLAVPVPGSWIDTFTKDWTPTSYAAPASTLYHVFLAFAEVLRVCDRLEKLG
jgi:mannose/cellobiose epimerase-like protein (N-acyl-D-glucosamine 2-epimerase family)